MKQLLMTTAMAWVYLPVMMTPRQLTNTAMLSLANSFEEMGMKLLRSKMH